MWALVQPILKWISETFHRKLLHHENAFEPCSPSWPSSAQLMEQMSGQLSQVRTHSFMPPLFIAHVPPPHIPLKLSHLLLVESAQCLSYIFHNISMQPWETWTQEDCRCVCVCVCVNACEKTRDCNACLQSVGVFYMCVISWVQHQLGPLLPDRLDSTAHLGCSLLPLWFNLRSLTLLPCPPSVGSSRHVSLR